jgi:hypothetical protein
MRRVKQIAIVLGLSGAALIAGSRAFDRGVVRAEEPPLPVLLGDNVQLRYDAERVRPCHVDQIRGHFVRCTRAHGDKGEEWNNLDRVEAIVRLSPWPQ